ncbi:hypothetical protein J6590_059072 [Homalodisca vitripennis]|nr:hypothetical protein J6590_059072 [Homalodisca vitripennis]
MFSGSATSKQLLDVDDHPVAPSAGGVSRCAIWEQCICNGVSLVVRLHGTEWGRNINNYLGQAPSSTAAYIFWSSR